LVDFPPEINSTTVARLFEGWYFEKTSLAQNEFKLAESQDIERNLRSLFRSSGLKIGHKALISLGKGICKEQ
jgi:hypothetical protein